MRLEAFLKDWGVVEARLRKKEINIGDLKRLVLWDWKNYKGEQKIDDYSHEDDSCQIPDCHQKIWFCRGDCGFKCSGPDYMKERRDHKKICRYYTETPRTPVFNHHDSPCCCCVKEYHDSKCPGKRKATLGPRKKKGEKRRRRRMPRI